MNIQIEKIKMNNGTEKEVTATVWENYGKRRVYFKAATHFKNRPTEQIAVYDLIAEQWIEASDFLKKVLPQAFYSILQMEQPAPIVEEAPRPSVATKEGWEAFLAAKAAAEVEVVTSEEISVEAEYPEGKINFGDAPEVVIFKGSAIDSYRDRESGHVAIGCCRPNTFDIVLPRWSYELKNEVYDVFQTIALEDVIGTIELYW